MGNMNNNQNENMINDKKETDSQYEKYTIAVMGASGVGKTFFWASYFNSVIIKGESDNVPTITGNYEHIKRLIRTIFGKHEKVPGDDRITDISFKLDSKNMEIDLKDLKGGNTTDIKNWDENEITPMLQNADGIMIFISAEDIVKNNKDKLLDENMAFAKAISNIRESQHGKWKNRADIPVWFIFTKGDKVEQEEDYLMNNENIGSLFKKANVKTDSSSVDFYDRLFEKGKNVKGFKVSAVGVKWEDDVKDAKVPENAKQSNIVKSMDELFDAMHKARYEHNNRILKIASISAFIVFVILCFANLSWQLGIIKNLEQNVNLAVSSSDFNSEAFNKTKMMIDRARNRFVFPEFLRDTDKINSLYGKTLEKYESFCYSKIAPNLDVDTNKVPTSEMASLINDVSNYLLNTDFNDVNKDHYEKVNNIKWYFEAAKKLKEAKDKTDNSGDSAETAYNTLSRWILDINEFPEVWLNELSVTTDKLVHLWSEKIQDFTVPNDYDKHIDNAKSLLSNPKIPNEINEFIRTNCLEKWENNKIALLQGEFNKLKTSLSDNSDVENSIKQINEFANNYPNLPVEINNQLKETKIQCLNVIVSNSISKTDVSIDDLRGLMQKYPEITEELKGKVESRIKQLVAEETKSVLSNINESNTFDDLDNSIVLRNDIIKKYPEVKGELDNTIYAKLQSINTDEVQKIKRKVSDFISSSAYGNAFDTNEKEFKKLESSISKYRENLGDRVSELISENKKEKENKRKEIDDSEYSFCRNTFNGKKANGDNNDIDYIISILKDYSTRSSNNSRISEIKDVVKYLQAIRSGLNGTLTIGLGDYNAGYGPNGYGLEAPDVQITVNSRNGKHSTDEKTDDYKPNFNDHTAFLWTSDLGDVTFSAVDIDSSYHDYIFTETINVNGFFGYEKLNNTLKGKGCTQNISFNASIPYCPWR